MTLSLFLSPSHGICHDLSLPLLFYGLCLWLLVLYRLLVCSHLEHRLCDVFCDAFYAISKYLCDGNRFCLKDAFPLGWNFAVGLPLNLISTCLTVIF